MEKDDYWTTGSAANSGWDVEPRGESDDDSYGDSDDDGFGHSGASSPQRSTGGSGSGSSGDKGGFAGGSVPACLSLSAMVAVSSLSASPSFVHMKVLLKTENP